MTKTTKVVLGSVMTMAMCASLIAGSTLALFTSESNVDLTITSGKVDVLASVEDTSFKTYTSNQDTATGKYTYRQYEDGATGREFSQGGSYTYENGTLTLTNIAGGEGISFNLVITNKSTISVKYQVRVSAENKEVGGTTKNLASQLRADFQFEKGSTPAPTYDVTKMTNDGGTHLSASSIFASDWSDEVQATTNPADGTKAATVPVGIWLPTDVPGDYAGAACTLKIAVYAVQANARVTNPTAGAFTIYNPADLYRFANEVNGGNTFDGQTVELGSDIFLSEPAAHRMAKRSAYALADAVPYASTAEGPWIPIGSTETAFKGTFDGHGYTIYGLKATGNGASTGLFGVVEDATIKDVILSNVTVSATGEGSVAGIVAAEARGKTTLSGVTVKNSTVTGETMTGGLIGKTAESSNLTVKDSSSELVSEGGDTLETEWAENNEGAIPKSSIFEIPSAEGLRAFAKLVNGGSSFAGITVVLTSDVDLVGENWTPIGDEAHPFAGNFDGQEKQITYSFTNESENALKYGGLFGVLCGTDELANPQKISNLTLNVTVVDNGGDSRMGGLSGKAYGNILVEKVNVKGSLFSNKIASGFFGDVKHTSEDAVKRENKAHVEIHDSNNYAAISAPKGVGFAANINGDGYANNDTGLDFVLIGCENHGDITLPEGATNDTVMGGFTGYFQGKNEIFTLTDCANYGDITIDITAHIGKFSVGGISGGGRGTHYYTNVVNEGTITVKDNESVESVKTKNIVGEIGGLIGSASGAKHLKHVENNGDILITTINQRDYGVGGLFGQGNSGTLEVDANDAGAHSIVKCTIKIDSTSDVEATNYRVVGAITGYDANAATKIENTDITVTLSPKSELNYGLAGQGNEFTHTDTKYDNIKNVSFKLTSDEYTSTVNWDGEGNVTVKVT